MKAIYVVAGTPSEYAAWVRQQPRETPDGEPIRYVQVTSTDNLRGRISPEFMFLKGWKQHPRATAIYNWSLSRGKRWWER